MLDYIIVGSGIAGIAFCETASKFNKKFIVFNDESQNSSKVAAGLYNPVILKRFSQVWHASEQLDILENFYTNLEYKLKCKLDYKISIQRKLFSIEEQNNWFVAADMPNLIEFLSSKLITKKKQFITSKFGFGEVLRTGYIDTRVLISEYTNLLKLKNIYVNETFDYSNLFISNNFIEYKNIKARHIIFAEGFGNRYNPFFNYLPVDGTKGELLIVKATDLDLKEIINSSIYLIPIGENLYKVGATYNWEDKTNFVTESGKSEIIKNLKNLISCDFDVVEHRAGVRPTVKDRRPLIGTHPKHNRLHILNGLGTRGVMIAPELAPILYNYIENNIPLDDYININRFSKLHSSNLD